MGRKEEMKVNVIGISFSRLNFFIFCLVDFSLAAETRAVHGTGLEPPSPYFL